jgi:hypothetical protein
MAKAKQTTESKIIRLGYGKPGALHFSVRVTPKSQQWASVLDAIASISYGEFFGEVISNWLYVNQNDYLSVVFGREYSPVLYVEYGHGAKIGKREMDELRDFFHEKDVVPTEMEVTKLAGLYTVRLWWD